MSFVLVRASSISSVSCFFIFFLVQDVGVGAKAE